MGKSVLERPEDDVEVLTAVLEVVDDRIDQRRRLERRSQQSEIALVELDPERLALEMFEPAMSQEPIPVLADPPANGRLTQIAAGLFTFDPLVPLRFFFPTSMETHPGFGGKLR